MMTHSSCCQTNAGTGDLCQRISCQRNLQRLRCAPEVLRNRPAAYFGEQSIIASGETLFLLDSGPELICPNVRIRQSSFADTQLRKRDSIWIESISRTSAYFVVII